MTRGTKKHTRAEINDELDKLKSTLGVGSGLGSLSISLQSKRENLPAVLDLLQRGPARADLPRDEFDILKRQQRGRASRRA